MPSFVEIRPGSETSRHPKWVLTDGQPDGQPNNIIPLTRARGGAQNAGRKNVGRDDGPTSEA